MVSAEPDLFVSTKEDECVHREIEAGIERGLQDLEEGKTTSHEAVRALLPEWKKKYAPQRADR